MASENPHIFLLFTNAGAALLTVLNLMALPAVLLIVAGAHGWRQGWKTGNEDRSRMGKMLLMFGIILLIIVLITSFSLEKIQLQNPPTL